MQIYAGITFFLPSILCFIYQTYMKEMIEKIGTNRQVKDKEVGVDFQRPFDILLKFKALQNDSDESLEAKRKGRTSKKPERPVLSG